MILKNEIYCSQNLNIVWKNKKVFYNFSNNNVMTDIFVIKIFTDRNYDRFIKGIHQHIQP